MSDGFNSHYFKDLYQLEENNFWFRARNKIIISAMKKFSRTPVSYFEIGCGTGYVTQAVQQAFPDCQITGSEMFAEGLQYAKSRMPTATFIQADATQLANPASADIVGIFDVLEHIEDDNKVLQSIHNMLKPDGLLFLTVPQHEWLWSDQDDIACHVRRYQAKDLHAKLRSNGFTILQSTSFVTLLLPLMFISRLRKNKKINKTYESNPTSELSLPPFVNRIFYFFMNIDLMLINAGIKLPFGGSRLIVAKK